MYGTLKSTILPFASAARLVELVAVRDDHHLGFDARRRRGDAAAKAEHRHDVMRRIGDLEALVAAHPARHHHALGVHVLEAVLLHRLDRPRDRAIEVVGAADALAEGVGELGEAIPRELIGLRGRDQLSALARYGSSHRRPTLGRRIGDERARKQDEDRGSGGAPTQSASRAAVVSAAAR